MSTSEVDGCNRSLSAAVAIAPLGLLSPFADPMLLGEPTTAMVAWWRNLAAIHQAIMLRMKILIKQYPLVNQDNYGKSLCLMGKLTINGDVQ